MSISRLLENGIGVDWQVCSAHIITKAKEISGEHALLPQTEKGAASGPFCDRVMDLCSRLCNVGQKLKSGDIPWEEAAKIEKRFVRELSPAKRGTNGRFASNLPKPSGPISHALSRNFYLLSSDVPAYRPLIIMRSSLSGIW